MKTKARVSQISLSYISSHRERVEALVMRGKPGNKGTKRHAYYISSRSAALDLIQELTPELKVSVHVPVYPIITFMVKE